MKKKDLNNFKKLLLKEKEVLINLLNVDKIQIKDLTKIEVGDLIDKAFNSYEKNKTIEMSENQKRLLQTIETALSKIEKNTYGLCIYCGQAIDFKRLEAIPWVNSCIQKTCISKKK